MSMKRVRHIYEKKATEAWKTQKWEWSQEKSQWPLLHPTTHVVKDPQPSFGLGFLCCGITVNGYFWFVLVAVDKFVWRNAFSTVQEEKGMKFHLWGQGAWEQISQSISLWQEVTFSLAGALPITGNYFGGIYIVPDTKCFIYAMTVIQQ